MLKQYFKQAWNMLCENRLISLISILGTALSIAMIMVVCLVFQIQSVSFSPETNRDRMLYIENGTKVSKGTDSWNTGNMSDEAVRECFYSLKQPEAVSAWFAYPSPLSLPGKQMYKVYPIMFTDPGFWKIYDFRFVDGKPFTDADFDAAISRAVVCESVARTLYGSTDVVGKPVIIDRLPYTICGVVKDVSRAADTSFAGVWVPYTTNKMVIEMRRMENMSGSLNVCLLARDKADYDAIRQEIKQQTARYNASKQECEISFFDNPITRFDKAIGSSGQKKIALKDYLMETGSLLLFLLLVPALNLIGVTQSAVQKRRSEMGLRKAFGATRGILVRQLLYENGLITLLGGAIGFLLSLFLLPVCKDFLLKNAETALNSDMLFRPAIFGAALLFCLLLNLLSAGIPAVRVSMQPITNALKGDEN
ncbi:ABC transporter permease [Parabacteroides faecis]|uniref:ABC transporter permease n=1 Tax=Parabacteroides faecis TaxID=1217282 RepID=UPI002164738A|nr:ABC transporter permease [Parabacteroides faecis]MCS2894479.1 ABC transporter permease [Parabacteroides faecis]UVQ46934.1 ABC transporter permease [Parabacteroides faecis]